MYDYCNRWAAQSAGGSLHGRECQLRDAYDYSLQTILIVIKNGTLISCVPLNDIVFPEDETHHHASKSRSSSQNWSRVILRNSNVCSSFTYFPRCIYNVINMLYIYQTSHVKHYRTLLQFVFG